MPGKRSSDWPDYETGPSSPWPSRLVPPEARSRSGATRAALALVLVHGLLLDLFRRCRLASRASEQHRPFARQATARGGLQWATN